MITPFSSFSLFFILEAYYKVKLIWDDFILSPSLAIIAEWYAETSARDISMIWSEVINVVFMLFIFIFQDGLYDFAVLRTN